MKSKGMYHNFMLDCNKDERLRKKMISVVKRKNIDAETLLKEFHKEHYEGVTITDCRKILKILENFPMELQKLEDTHY